MKIDRLIGIVMYLLNRNVVSAKALAERFEVSVRTIARDVRALSIAGIPISSLPGAAGGYQILDTFKLDKQITTQDDYRFIITALKGFSSAYDDKKISATLDKLRAIEPPGEASQRVFIDFGVVREGNSTCAIEGAIREKRMIEFDYTNATGQKSHRLVEPLALNYRWYAWYLLAFCIKKSDYRLFKLSRIADLTVTDKPVLRVHEDVSELLKRQWEADDRRCIQIKLKCRAHIRVAALEYLKGTVTQEYAGGDFVMVMNGIEGERMWLSLILGFGDAAEVLEPQEVIDMLKEKSGQIQKLYGISDIQLS